MKPQNSQDAATESQGSEAEQDPDFGPAIAELERAARKKQVDAEAAKAGLLRCFKAYRDGYSTNDTHPGAVEIVEEFKKRQSVTKAKPHLKRMTNNLATLQNQIDELMHHNQLHLLLWFAADAYAELPEVKAELDKRNSKIIEELKNSEFVDDIEYEDALAATHWAGIDILGQDLTELRRAMDVMCHRLKAISKVRAPRPSREPTQLRRFVLELGELYCSHTERTPVAGGDQRNKAPFVRFVYEVLRQTDPEEAERMALGQTIYGWLVEEKEYQEFPATIELLDR